MSLNQDSARPVMTQEETFTWDRRGAARTFSESGKRLAGIARRNEPVKSTRTPHGRW
jgi:hypothetical protein